MLNYTLHCKKYCLDKVVDIIEQNNLEAMATEEGTRQGAEYSPRDLVANKEQFGKTTISNSIR